MKPIKKQPSGCCGGLELQRFTSSYPARKMTPTYPPAYFRCAQCLTPIVLPYPRLQEQTLDRPRRPKDGWFVNFHCCECGLQSRYTPEDIRFGFYGENDRSSTRFFRIEHECGVEGCGLPIVLHTIVRVAFSSDQLRLVALKTSPPVRCPAGHQIGGAAKFVSAVETFDLVNIQV